jgi:hypothetical protein
LRAIFSASRKAATEDVLMMQVTLERCWKLDIREWTREGKLIPGTFFVLPLRADAPYEGVQEIEVTVEKEKVRLEYDVRVGVAETLHVPMWTPLSRSRCHYGGSRCWFVCFWCGRRVATLWMHNLNIACRACHGLRYRSQDGTPLQRAFYRAQKLRVQLGGTPDFDRPLPAKKPKRMHWTTWLDARERYYAACDAFHVQMEPLQRRIQEHKKAAEDLLRGDTG